MNPGIKVIIPLSIVALLAVGVAIPRYTVRNLVTVEPRLEQCLTNAIYLHYDNPLERLALSLGKSRIVSADIASAEIESFTIFRTPMGVLRGDPDLKLGVFCNLAGDWNSNVSGGESVGVASLAEQLAECLPKSDWASREQCQQLLQNIRNFDDCVAAGFSIMKSNPPQCATPDGRTFKQETNGTWEMAMLAVNDCRVEEVFQTHSRIVTLTLKNGSRLIAAEPEIDDIFDVVSKAELKCGRIRRMGTE